MTSGCGVVDLIPEDRPAQRIGADLSPQPGTEITTLHGGRWQGHFAGKLKASETIAFVIEKEKGVISSDWAADRPAEIVLFLIVFGSAKRVCQHAGSVKHRVLVVFEERPMKLIGS